MIDIDPLYYCYCSFGLEQQMVGEVRREELYVLASSGLLNPRLKSGLLQV